VLIGMGGLVAKNVAGTLGSGSREALVISGWVLMWRPIDVLIYERIGEGKATSSGAGAPITPP
jgi:hypothetical protein